MTAHARWQTVAGLALLAVLALPWARAALEATMWRHMLVQFPLGLLVGLLLAAALPHRARVAAARWNGHGLSGLVAASVILAVLMIPRVLDLALYRPGIEAAKLAALVLAGGALRLSWRSAGLIVQSFFLGYLLAMMAIVGVLYIEAPLRLCNAYLLDDQLRLGRWLVGVATVLGVAWSVHVFRILAHDGYSGMSPGRAPECGTSAAHYQNGRGGRHQSNHAETGACRP